MKRFMIASAVALSTATAAFAASEGEIAEVQQYLPNYDVSSWSDTQINEAMAIINSSDSRADRMGRLDALARGETYASGGAQLTEAEMVELSKYVDGVDFTALPQAVVDAALLVANSEMSASDREGRIQELLTADGTAMFEGNTATSGEVALINSAAPDIDVSTLSDPQVNSILALIYSTDEGEISAAQLEKLAQQ